MCQRLSFFKRDAFPLEGKIPMAVRQHGTEIQDPSNVPPELISNENHSGSLTNADAIWRVSVIGSGSPAATNPMNRGTKEGAPTGRRGHLLQIP